MRSTYLIALAAGGLLAGCGGEPEAPVTPPAPAPQAQSVDVTASAAPVTPPPGVEAPPSAPAAANIEVSEDDLLGGKGRPLTEQEVMLISYGVSMFREEKGRYPTTLEEAVASRHIMRLPQLPAGEKFAYDPQTGSVRVEKTN